MSFLLDSRNILEKTYLLTGHIAGIDKLTSSQLWLIQVESETQQIPPIPPAKDGTPRDEWLGGGHPDGQLEVIGGFHMQADFFQDEAAVPIAQGLRARDLCWRTLTGGARWRLVQDGRETDSGSGATPCVRDPKGERNVACSRSKRWNWRRSASRAAQTVGTSLVSRLTNKGFRVHSSKAQVLISKTIP